MENGTGRLAEVDADVHSENRIGGECYLWCHLLVGAGSRQQSASSVANSVVREQVASFANSVGCQHFRVGFGRFVGLIFY